MCNASFPLVLLGDDWPSRNLKSAIAGQPLSFRWSTLGTSRNVIAAPVRSRSPSLVGLQSATQRRLDHCPAPSAYCGSGICVNPAAEFPYSIPATAHVKRTHSPVYATREVARNLARWLAMTPPNSMCCDSVRSCPGSIRRRIRIDSQVPSCLSQFDPA